jgi:hypothetical protein
MSRYDPFADSDRINDRIDARNLATAYARGGTREVHRPSAPYSGWRDIFFGYRTAVKDSVRCPTGSGASAPDTA